MLISGARQSETRTTTFSIDLDATVFALSTGGGFLPCMRVSVYVRMEVDGGGRRVGRRGEGTRRGAFQCNFRIWGPTASCKAATLCVVQSEKDFSRAGIRFVVRDRSYSARLCCRRPSLLVGFMQAPFRYCNIAHHLCLLSFSLDCVWRVTASQARLSAHSQVFLILLG